MCYFHVHSHTPAKSNPFDKEQSESQNDCERESGMDLSSGSEKNTRITGDTSAGHPAEEGNNEKINGNERVPAGGSDSPGVRVDETACSNKSDAGAGDGISQLMAYGASASMHTSEIDAAINLEPEFASSNAMDKLLAPQQSSNLLPPALDGKMTPMMHPPTMPPKFSSGAHTHGTTYSTSNNYGITPHAPYEDLMPPALGAPSNFAHAYHPNASMPMEVDVGHNAYGNLFTSTTSAPGGAPPIGGDFVRPSQAPYDYELDTVLGTAARTLWYARIGRRQTTGSSLWCTKDRRPQR